jgi:hypothetical protein
VVSILDKEIIRINSKHKLIVSESDTETDVLLAKFIICDFGVNKNEVKLNQDTINDWLETLLIKPLVGKVVKKYNGVLDFTGHNVKIVEKTDEDGNKYKDVEFDTSAFGSFYNVDIETIDDVDYIVANAKVWKRFTEAYSVIQRRCNSENGIKTSWEIEVLESHQEMIDGVNVKVIDKGNFIGHCLLGESVEPAYDSSGLLSVASANIDDSELVEALSKDIENMNNIKTNITSEAEEISEEEDNKINSLQGGISSMSETVKKEGNELSSMTDNDLYSRIRKAINATDDSKWYYIARIYPYEFRAIAYEWNQESEDDYVEFIYSVNSDETISITSQKDVKMTFAPVSDVQAQLSEKDTKISELETKVSELEADVATKVDAITKAGEQLSEKENVIAEKDTKIAELLPYKEAKDAEIAEQKAQELAQKKKECKTFAMKGGYITEEEIETSEEIKKAIDELDYKSIKAMIAEKVISKLEKAETEKKEEEIETSSVEHDDANVKININASNEKEDPTEAFRTFLRG